MSFLKPNTIDSSSGIFICCACNTSTIMSFFTNRPYKCTACQHIRCAECGRIQLYYQEPPVQYEEKSIKTRYRADEGMLWIRFGVVERSRHWAEGGYGYGYGYGDGDSEVDEFVDEAESERLRAERRARRAEGGGFAPYTFEGVDGREVMGTGLSTIEEEEELHDFDDSVSGGFVRDGEEEERRVGEGHSLGDMTSSQTQADEVEASSEDAWTRAAAKANKGKGIEGGPFTFSSSHP